MINLKEMDYYERSRYYASLFNVVLKEIKTYDGEIIDLKFNNPVVVDNYVLEYVLKEVVEKPDNYGTGLINRPAMFLSQNDFWEKIDDGFNVKRITSRSIELITKKYLNNIHKSTLNGLANIHREHIIKHNKNYPSDKYRFYANNLIHYQDYIAYETLKGISQVIRSYRQREILAMDRDELESIIKNYGFISQYNISDEDLSVGKHRLGMLIKESLTYLP